MPGNEGTQCHTHTHTPLSCPLSRCPSALISPRAGTGSSDNKLRAPSAGSCLEQAASLLCFAFRAFSPRLYTAEQLLAPPHKPAQIVRIVLGRVQTFSFSRHRHKGRGEGGSPEYEDFFMPSLRAVAWEGCSVPGVPRSFCGQGRGGDAHGATASVPGSGPGAAQRSQLSAHTFPQPHTHRGGLFQVSRHGQGKSGAQPRPRLHLTPAAPEPSPGLCPKGSPPCKSRGIQPPQPREGMEFHASSPAHPMDLIQPLAGWSSSGQLCSAVSSSKCISDP